MMRKPTLAAVFVITALAVANIGFKLAGAMRQLGALADAKSGLPPSAVYPEEAGATPRAEYVSAASPEPSGRVARERPAPATESPASASEPPVRFDTEAALREAGDRDPSVTDLLNDGDPAVGAAVRDFITSLAPTGGDSRPVADGPTSSER